MMSAADMTALTRRAASALVDREEDSTRSRMLAWSNIASRVGASSSWLQKFVNDYAEVKEPRWSVGWNILAQCYDRLCVRIETAADKQWAEEERLRMELHEVLSGAAEIGQGLARASGGSPHAAVGRPLPPRRQ